MIPMKVLALEHDIGNHSKHAETDALLYHL